MKITRNTLPTTPGPADWFTGTVHIDMIAAPEASSTVAAANVHFAPGARTAWHTHPHGQTIWVTEGAGRCQRDGGPVETLQPGDRVFFEPGERHWHGASADRFMVHVAIQQADDAGEAVVWEQHVTDEEYAGASS
jgi:quercetin dioxygenase-like cupin family protein